MPEYTYVVTQRTNYYRGVEFEKPEDVIAWIAEGDGWDDSKNEVLSDRVQVFDEQGFLVADTEPSDCVDCGRSEVAGFVDGDPYCHRHIEAHRRGVVAQGIWRVTYQVRSLASPPPGSLVREAAVQIAAPTRERAGELAAEWVHLNDPYCDDRIQPIVQILHVEEAEEASNA